MKTKRDEGTKKGEPIYERIIEEMKKFNEEGERSREKPKMERLQIKEKRNL